MLSNCSSNPKIVDTKIIKTDVPVFIEIDKMLLKPCHEMEFWYGMTVYDLIEQANINILDDVACNKKLKEIEKNNERE